MFPCSGPFVSLFKLRNSKLLFAKNKREKLQTAPVTYFLYFVFKYITVGVRSLSCNKHTTHDECIDELFERKKKERESTDIITLIVTHE
jgi:hypothetical protein